MLNFVENLLENDRGPMNDQDLTKTDYDPDRSLVLVEGLSHFLTNFLQNLVSCQTSFTGDRLKLWSKFNDIFKNYLTVDNELTNEKTKFTLGTFSISVFFFATNCTYISEKNNSLWYMKNHHRGHLPIGII
jgi:hypothetical protein